MEDRKIRVAITHGDTNGIGYELIFKTFAEPEMLELCTPIIYGSPKIASYHRKAMETQASFSIINKAEDAQDGRVNLLACFDDDVKVELGVPTKESGEAALKALDRAMTDYRSQLFDVLVACPVNQASMSDANYEYRGLKEYSETSIGDGAKGMKILINETLRIALATNGLAIKDVPSHITEEGIADSLRTLDKAMRRDFRLSNPRIAVLALNPVADGEEERSIIGPAVCKAADEGINAYGPYAADEYFGQNLCEHFDCTLAMYDDQAVIPFTTLMQNDGIYYVASLPLVCTAPALTPDFDAAGRGISDESALRHAIYEAIDIVRNRAEYDEPLANPLPKLYHEKRDESEKVRFSIPKKREGFRSDRKPAPRQQAATAPQQAPQPVTTPQPQAVQPAQAQPAAADAHDAD